MLLPASINSSAERLRRYDFHEAKARSEKKIPKKIKIQIVMIAPPLHLCQDVPSIQ